MKLLCARVIAAAEIYSEQLDALAITIVEKACDDINNGGH
jgi:hypothetical protein